MKRSAYICDMICDLIRDLICDLILFDPISQVIIDH
jgi:hypothetical protein